MQSASIRQETRRAKRIPRYIPRLKTVPGKLSRYSKDRRDEVDILNSVCRCALRIPSMLPVYHDASLDRSSMRKNATSTFNYMCQSPVLTKENHVLVPSSCFNRVSLVLDHSSELDGMATLKFVRSVSKDNRSDITSIKPISGVGVF